jgi:hypothetical protein
MPDTEEMSLPPEHSPYYILDDNNQPQAADPRMWNEWLASSKDKQVAHDSFSDSATEENVSVSTVFLGINHNWGAGAPLIYETMVFGGTYADTCDRCSTRNEAIAQHNDACRRVAASLGQDWSSRKPTTKAKLDPLPRVPPAWRADNNVLRLEDINPYD